MAIKIDVFNTSLTTEKPVINKCVSGCDDCPFCIMNDISVGYSCRIDNAKQLIKESKMFSPITPKWCPLKQVSMIVQYRK